MTRATATSTDRHSLWRTTTIIPPEGVPLPFRIAALGTRFYAQFVDLLLTFLFLGLFALTLWAADLHGYIEILLILAFFFLRLPYYILTEVYWNGATLGKRLTRIRVVDAGGGPLDVHAVLVRNLLKEAEVFLPIGLLLGLGDMAWGTRLAALGWCALALAVPLMNRRRQRLGDIIANTMVVHRPDAILLPDADARAAAPNSGDTEQAFAFTTGQLDQYGAFELQTLEALLRAIQAKGKRPLGRMPRQQLAEVADAIRARIGYEATVAPKDNLRFLQDFYRAQRRHLEERQLFGERRADKYHARGPKP